MTNSLRNPVRTARPRLETRLPTSRHSADFTFYVPALERSVRYDRIAGFFSSAALSVAAQGIASMIARGGRMRLLVGAQLSQRDVDAILRGVELRDTLTQKVPWSPDRS